MSDRWKEDIIDEDLYEDLTDEEWYEIVKKAQREARLREVHEQKENIHKPKRPFPKWAVWLIVIAMFLHVFALFPQVISLPIIDFLKTSAKLSLDHDMAMYKRSVVVIETNDGRGTGFSIAKDGTILTNFHVVEGSKEVTVSFQDEGLFVGEVAEIYPDIDLAIVTIEGNEMPYLDLADEASYAENDTVYMIGNPFKFHRIANKGNIIDDIQLKNWNEKVVMIKAPVYQGNSGSPVINNEGEVIGVVFATLQSKQHGKVGLFIPIEHFNQKSDINYKEVMYDPLLSQMALASRTNMGGYCFFTLACS